MQVLKPLPIYSYPGLTRREEQNSDDEIYEQFITRSKNSQ